MLRHHIVTPVVQGLFLDADVSGNGSLDKEEMTIVLREYYKKQRLGRSLSSVKAEVSLTTTCSLTCTFRAILSLMLLVLSG